MLVPKRWVPLLVSLVLAAQPSLVSALPTSGESCRVSGRVRVTALGTLRCQPISGVLRWRQVVSPAASVVLTCSQGGVCKVGDAGPGGGIVFYIALTPFASVGSDCATACRYLEAAPLPNVGELLRTWATGANQLLVVPGGAVRTAIGGGMANTLAIAAQAGNVAESSAAMYAYDYVNGGKSDWHLPSRDELDELYFRQSEVGGFVGGYYWSSTEDDSGHAWDQGFIIGFQDFTNKSFLNKVRPVRAL